jgi:hypothetical protein
MFDKEIFKLRNPELEAEIYYLTPQEGGRQTAVFSGYRGQFYYDGRNWDAPQQFLDKEMCSPGETVKVYLQTLSPHYHTGKFYIGKEFEVREGGRIVGKGKVTGVIRKDFEYWDGKSFLTEIGSSLQPYVGGNLKGFQKDCEYYLKGTGLFASIKYIKSQDLACLLTIKCKLKSSATLREVGDKVINTWKEYLALENQKIKVEYCIEYFDKEPWSKLKGFYLEFATWNQLFITGVIKIIY